MPSGKPTPKPVADFIKERRENAPGLSHKDIAEKVEAEFAYKIDPSTVGKLLGRSGSTAKDRTSGKALPDYRFTAILQRWHAEVERFVNEWSIAEALGKVEPREQLFTRKWSLEDSQSPTQTVESMYEDLVLRQFASLEEPTRLHVRVQSDPIFPLLMNQLQGTEVPTADKAWGEAYLGFILLLQRWYFKVSSLGSYVLQEWPSSGANVSADTEAGRRNPADSTELVRQGRALSMVLACDLLAQEIGRHEPSLHISILALALNGLRKHAQEDLMGDLTGFKVMPVTKELILPLVQDIPYYENVIDGLGPLLDSYVAAQEATLILLDKLGSVQCDWHGSPVTSSRTASL